MIASEGSDNLAENFAGESQVTGVPTMDCRLISHDEMFVLVCDSPLDL